MATQRTAAKTRRARTPLTRLRDRAYGVPVPEALHEAIENERSTLSKAESVLGCLAIAMENETDTLNRPYYPDVAQLARELVRQSINGLDSLALQRHLLRNKIKEGPGLPYSDGARLVCDCTESSADAVTCGATRTNRTDIRAQSMLASSKSRLGPILH